MEQACFICGNCLYTTRKIDEGKMIKMYHHIVLEAKIVLSDKIVISLGTEFIENKKAYPRLPICIQGDALYATEPFMKLCKKTCHWEYLFTQKETRQKKLHESFEWIRLGEDATRQPGLCKPCGGSCRKKSGYECFGV